MSKVTIDTILETIKELTEEQQATRDYITFS